MPLLSYSYPPFVPFTVIKSAEVNGKYSDIQTLLNVTGLDDVNIQNAGITRATKLKLGTANYVLINDGTGAMSEEQFLSTSRGGLGIDLTPSIPGQVVQVDSGGTQFVLSTTPEAPGSKLYNSSRFY